MHKILGGALNGAKLNNSFRSHSVFTRDSIGIRPSEGGQNIRPDLGYDGEDAVAPFPQPFWELLLSFAVAFIPIAIVIWDHQTATEAQLETQASAQLRA